MKIAVSRLIPDAGLALLREQADELRVWDGELPPSREELLRLADGCDGLLSLLTDRIDGPFLDSSNTLHVVSNFAVGFDNIDVPACTERGIAACITPDVLTDTTADFAFALLVSCARRIPEASASVKRGEWKTWEPKGFLGQDIHGKTMGIVGFGRIGQAMARRAAGFGMSVIYSDAQANPDAAAELGAEYVELDDLLQRSDFVSLHVPLTESTRHMISRDQLSLMKSSSILINTARGPVVDSDALVEALEQNEIWAVGLDVTDPEPLPADHPLVHHPRAVVVPHIASASEQTRDRMAELAATNLLTVLKGEQPPRCLNPEVLEQ